MEADAVAFKKGDWVADKTTNHRPNIGIVKDAYQDAFGSVIDIILYNREGIRIGRVTEAAGGPTTFEPACPAENYAKIVEPCFPLKVGHGGDYSGQLKFI